MNSHERDKARTGIAMKLVVVFVTLGKELPESLVDVLMYLTESKNWSPADHPEIEDVILTPAGKLLFIYENGRVFSTINDSVREFLSTFADIIELTPKEKEFLLSRLPQEPTAPKDTPFIMSEKDRRDRVRKAPTN